MIFDLVVAPRHALRAVVVDRVGGTLDHWRSVYQHVINELREKLRPPHRVRMWPDDWFAGFNNSSYTRHGHRRNPWSQFDAVVAQLQRAMLTIADECSHKDAELLNTQQRIQHWRQRMLPAAISFECFSCGGEYHQRVAVDDERSDSVDSNCTVCAKTIAANHAVMMADYLETLSPAARKAETESNGQTLQRSPKKALSQCGAVGAMPSSENPSRVIL